MYNPILITLILTLFVTQSFAQRKEIDAITDSLQKEATVLYKSEMASWYGTDIFMEKLQGKRNLLGGYLSYDTGKGVNNILFSKGDNPDVLATITFNYDFDLKNYSLDTASRKLNKSEKELYELRQAALSAFRTDTFFKKFNNTGTNLIPVNASKHKRVYILTSPQQNGSIIIGNDYLIDFDNNNRITSKKKLHRNILEFKTDSKEVQTSAIHSHLPETGDFITATDICTLMLYGKFTTWKQHYVMSKNYVSIWDIQKQELLILTMDAWKRIAEDQAKRHPKGASQ